MTNICSKGVLDTNIYRGLPKEGYKNRVKEYISTVALSPLNVLEITGIDIPNNEKDLSRRQAAARRMLELCDEWVVDPEIYQAQLLGCDVTGYGFSEFEQALQRFISAKSVLALSQPSTGVDVAFSRQARNRYYQSFVEKIHLLRTGYLSWCQDNNIEKRYDEISISRAMVEIDAHSIVRQAEFERISNTVKLYQADKDFHSSVLGMPNPNLISKLDDYTAIYTDYVIEHLKSAKENADKNDFGDLQFLIYCAGDYCLATKEEQWLKLAAMGNLADKVFKIP